MIVDQEGRLFGGVNLFDAMAAVVVLAMLALGLVGYRLLRVPAAPVIATLTPSTMTAGPDVRIVVTGDNLLPYYRAYLQRSRRPSAVMHDLNPFTRFDNYTLVNYAQARWLIESPQLAELRPTDGLLPGTYDLILQNEVNIVAVREAAFTVTPAPPAPHAAEIEAAVRVRGTFGNLPKDVAARLVAGTKLPFGAAAPWGEILSVGPPAFDETRIDFGDKTFLAAVPTRWQVRAELRVLCGFGGYKCILRSGEALLPGAVVSIDVAGTPLRFVVTELLPDRAEPAPADATVTVRFVGLPAVMTLVHEQDADTSPGDDRTHPAKIVSVTREADVTTELTASLSDGSVRVPTRVSVAACVVRIPVAKVPTGWSYRSQPIKAGAPITFQTDGYIVRGTIVSVTFPTR
jgi:hypothetical protein